MFYAQSTSTDISGRGSGQESNLVFYAQSTGTGISGRGSGQLHRKNETKNKQKTLVFYSSLSILFTFHLPIDHRLSSSRAFSRAMLFVCVGGVTEGGGG